MLHQNWFMDKKFDMFYEYYECQKFFDTETEIIYVVTEENGSVFIQEITAESDEYAANKLDYDEWKKSERS